MGERRGQGEEWSELGRVGVLPGSSRTREMGERARGMAIGQRGGGEGDRGDAVGMARSGQWGGREGAGIGAGL